MDMYVFISRCVCCLRSEDSGDKISMTGILSNELPTYDKIPAMFRITGGGGIKRW